MSEKLSQLRDEWINRLWLDYVIAAVILGVHLLLILLLPATDAFGNASPSDRRGVYSSAAVVVSLLASFSGVAVGQLGSARGHRTAALKQFAGQELARNWRAIFVSGLLAALTAVLALLLDPSQHTDSAVPVVLRILFEAALLVAVVRFFRASELFTRVVGLSSQESGEAETSLAAAPTPQPNWARKTA